MQDYTTTIILTIFNKEKNLDNVLTSIFENTSCLVKEYIFILDGCIDNSSEILINKINKIPHNATHKILTANDVFEIRANNIGLREVTTPYAIIIQDDMVIKENDWNERLLIPIQKFNDIWAVTARTSCSLNTNGTWYNINEGPVGHKYSDVTNYPRNTVYVGQVVNRGPLLIKMDVIKSVNFFDESLPGCIGCDDVDACLKIYIKFGLRCCSFYTKYVSPLEWGSTRTGPNASFCALQERLNINEVVNRYKNLLDTWNYNEIRYV